MTYKLIARDEENQKIIDSHNWEIVCIAENTNDKDIYACVNCSLCVYSSLYVVNEYYSKKCYSSTSKIDNKMTCNEILMRNVLK